MIPFLVEKNHLTSEGLFLTLISEGGGGLNKSPFFKLVKTTEKVNFLDFFWYGKM